MLWICKYILFFQLISSYFMLCQTANYNSKKKNNNLQQIVENSDIHNNKLMPSISVSTDGCTQLGLQEVMCQEI